MKKVAPLIPILLLLTVGAYFYIQHQSAQAETQADAEKQPEDKKEEKEIILPLPLPDIGKTKVTTNIVATDKESDKGAKVSDFPLSNIVDGDAKTYFWTGAHARKGNSITFEFDKPLEKGKTLKFYTGFGVTNNEDGDAIQDGELHYSTDEGKSWQYAASFVSSNAEVIVPETTNLFRILITKSSRRWIAVRDVKISDSALTTILVKGNAKLNGITIPLSIKTDLEGFEDLKPHFETSAKLFFEVWPKLMTQLGANVDEIPRDIDITFVNTLPHPAHAGGHTMTISAKHFKEQPKDVEGVFVHELGHIVQQYQTYKPTWFVEGSADYLRYRQFPDRKWANSARKRMNNDRPLSQYWNSACFLLWMEDTYKKPVVSVISRAIYDKKYKESLFKDITGHTLDELVEMYKKSGYRPTLQSPKLPQ